MDVTIGSAAFCTKIVNGVTTNIFCVTGPSGSAVSTNNGESWTIARNDYNLRQVTYRADLGEGVFLARANKDNHYYTSADGKSWVRLSKTPIPCAVDTVSCATYCPKYKLYAAAPVYGNTVYFSKDLEHWGASEVPFVGNLNSEIEWVGGDYNKFFIFPRTGSYYYTLDPKTAWGYN